MSKIAIVIPAYNPREYLVEIVEYMSQNDENIIVVVNDGTEDKKIFDKIKNKCIIIEHDKNLGYGRAVKTGFTYILENHKEVIGVVTADADGQHIIKDIEKVRNELIQNPETLILGSRNFKQKGIPMRNKLGNVLMSHIFRFKTGIKLEDTQSGLRAIPIKLVEKIKDISGEKFDYVTNTLYELVTNNEYKIVEIETVYDKNNISSFKPIRDSVLILKEILKK